MKILEKMRKIMFALLCGVAVSLYAPEEIGDGWHIMDEETGDSGFHDRKGPGERDEIDKPGEDLSQDEQDRQKHEQGETDRTGGDTGTRDADSGMGSDTDRGVVDSGSDDSVIDTRDDAHNRDAGRDSSRDTGTSGDSSGTDAREDDHIISYDDKIDLDTGEIVSSSKEFKDKYLNRLKDPVEVAERWLRKGDIDADGIKVVEGKLRQAKEIVDLYRSSSVQVPEVDALVKKYDAAKQKLTTIRLDRTDVLLKEVKEFRVQADQLSGSELREQEAKVQELQEKVVEEGEWTELALVDDDIESMLTEKKTFRDKFVDTYQELRAEEQELGIVSFELHVEAAVDLKGELREAIDSKDREKQADVLKQIAEEHTMSPDTLELMIEYTPKSGRDYLLNKAQEFVDVIKEFGTVKDLLNIQGRENKGLFAELQDRADEFEKIIKESSGLSLEVKEAKTVAEKLQLIKDASSKTSIKDIAQTEALNLVTDVTTRAFEAKAELSTSAQELLRIEQDLATLASGVDASMFAPGELEAVQEFIAKTKESVASAIDESVQLKTLENVSKAFEKGVLEADDVLHILKKITESAPTDRVSQEIQKVAKELGFTVSAEKVPQDVSTKVQNELQQLNNTQQITELTVAQEQVKADNAELLLDAKLENYKYGDYSAVERHFKDMVDAYRSMKSAQSELDQVRVDLVEQSLGGPLKYMVVEDGIIKVDKSKALIEQALDIATLNDAGKKTIANKLLGDGSRNMSALAVEAKKAELSEKIESLQDLIKENASLDWINRLEVSNDSSLLVGPKDGENAPGVPVTDAQTRELADAWLKTVDPSVEKRTQEQVQIIANARDNQGGELKQVGRDLSIASRTRNAYREFLDTFYGDKGDHKAPDLYTSSERTTIMENVNGSLSKDGRLQEISKGLEKSYNELYKKWKLERTGAQELFKKEYHDKTLRIMNDIQKDLQRPVEQQKWLVAVIDARFERAKDYLEVYKRTGSKDSFMQGLQEKYDEYRAHWEKERPLLIK